MAPASRPAQKWSFLPGDLFPRYLVINADEGEPSTFKDRMLVERDPHQLVEGIAISAFAIQCNQAFVYLRGEFALGYERLTQAIAAAKAKGFLGANILGSGFDLEIVVHRGAGAYICGEETALLESLEGERGMPRIRPPFPAIAGLYAKPTVVNNVETLSTVPAHRDDGRRGVRQARRQPLDRHAPLLRVGPREPTGQLRSRARRDVPRSHLRHRRRDARRAAR